MRRRAWLPGAAIAAGLALVVASCGLTAGDRENRYNNVAVRGRQDTSAYVINMPKAWDNVALKCIPASEEDGGVIVVGVTREQAGIDMLHMKACPAAIQAAMDTP